MATVDYRVTDCSETGSARFHVDNILTPDRNTYVEVDANSLDLSLSYPPTPVSKIIVCVKVSIRIRIDLYSDSKLINRLSQAINCETESFAVTLKPNDNKTNTNRAVIHIDRSVNATPIRVVFVLLQTERREGEGTGDSRSGTGNYGPCQKFYSDAPRENEAILKRKAPTIVADQPSKATKLTPKRPIDMLSASPPSAVQPPGHVPMDYQTLITPYETALVGIVVGAILEDVDLMEIMSEMVEALGGLYVSELEELVQVVVVDHSLTEAERNRLAKCPKAKVVGWTWLQACQDAGMKVDWELYQCN